MRVNIAIALTTAAVTIGIWLAAFNGDSARQRGARTYCETLLEHGALHEPIARCIAEYERASR